MSDLERRLRRTLRELPDADDAARARAEAAALAALPPAPRRRRWPLVAGGLLAAAVVAGAALAATDRLDVRIGAPSAPRPAPAATDGPAPGRLALPAGASGLGAVVDGRLWLRTAGGLGVQGLAVTAAELSPRALYAAVGIGSSLVAMAPDGRRAWTRATPGRVVAIAWAPNPIAIAYVVQAGARHELHVIEGDGDGDRLLDRDVAPVRPSWRADALALAYVGADGAARVAAYPSLRVERTLPPPAGRVAHVAFAPSGGRLALATAGTGARLGLAGPAGAQWTDPGLGARLRALAWSSPGELVAAGDETAGGAPAGRLWVIPAGAQVSGKARAAAEAPAVLALAPAGAARLVATVRTGGEVQVWEAATPRTGQARLTPRRVLLRVPAGGGSASLSLR